MSELRPDQIRRYSRQILLQGIGGRGQRSLLAAEATLIGLGPVGMWCAAYLAAAGVGSLFLADPRALTEQECGTALLSSPQDVGMPREQVLAKTLRELNPDISVRLRTHNVGCLIYCGACAETYDGEGFCAGVLGDQAMVGTTQQALHDGEGPLGPALAALAGSLGAQEAIRQLVRPVQRQQSRNFSFDLASLAVENGR